MIAIEGPRHLTHPHLVRCGCGCRLASYETLEEAIACAERWRRLQPESCASSAFVCDNVPFNPEDHD